MVDTRLLKSVYTIVSLPRCMHLFLFNAGGEKMENKSHWENIYNTKGSTEVSWYQEHQLLSLRFIEFTGVDKAGEIIDVGGGTSTLVDDLLARGFRHITVLDISATAYELRSSGSASKPLRFPGSKPTS